MTSWRSIHVLAWGCSKYLKFPISTQPLKLSSFGTKKLQRWTISSFWHYRGHLLIRLSTTLDRDHHNEVVNITASRTMSNLWISFFFYLIPWLRLVSQSQRNISKFCDIVRLETLPSFFYLCKSFFSPSWPYKVWRWQINKDRWETSWRGSERVQTKTISQTNSSNYRLEMWGVL